MADIKNKLCRLSDWDHKLERLTRTDNGRYVPVAQVCPDLWKMQKGQTWHYVLKQDHQRR